ncbi:hypothetical protein [Terracidiphilus gabretensis]|uniref:hypothetical protein n=1 Tax=Terracidiphilus gabretensis TaxID=1577687 RepID=UPI0012F9AC87|nr:hypothetical protein [Terracidiphilus gabretensis]
MQAVIAAVAAIIAADLVITQIAMTSFNNFYFGPHKAYPYPYPDVHSAQVALYRNCGLTMLGVFTVAFMIQRLVIKPLRG